MIRILLLALLAAACFSQEAEKTADKAPPPPPPPPRRDQARALVVSQQGIVAASNYLASSVGAKILEQGGNAIDAAIAANAITGLTQPFVNGVGGDLFAIVYETKSGRLYGLNASGWSPKAQTIEWLKEKGVEKIDPISVHTITVPGAVGGWAALRERFGTRSLKELLAPAIHYAQQGFPLSVVSARSMPQKKFFEQAGFKDTYLAAGEKPEPGDLFRNPGLARTLRLVAEHGHDGFYRSDYTRGLVAFLRELGGAHSYEDFAEWEPEWVEPVATTYRGWKVYELPPNGQGIAALSMLNIMEHFPMGDYGHNSAAALHAMIESKKLSYADMAKYVGDPKFTAIPTETLISKQLGDQRSKLIDMRKAACQVLPANLSQTLTSAGRETIYLSAIDKEGNIVSLIQSNSAGYGTGLVAPGAGFSFHNRGARFELEPDKPDSLEGRKRPLHTIIPAFMEKDDLKIGFGIMGGWNQPLAHAQFVANLVDFEMNAQEALEAPRFTKMTFEGCDVMLESRIGEAIRFDLARRGHVVTPVSNYNSNMGFGSAVIRDTKRGVNFAATDPRVDGAAIPEEPAYLP
ncbi:MAG: gamma-glutamyltransferase family protein [Bryobacterales bacterium]|nr:gamma-glutamyltransferase family protein [Bryobacterales bacterium]